MVVASTPRQAPHGSDELAAADDAPRSEHNGTVPVLAICYGAFAVLLVAAHAGQKAGLVEPPVEEATHQQALEESVAEFEESLSKDSRVSIKKDDGEA